MGKAGARAGEAEHAPVGAGRQPDEYGYLTRGGTLWSWPGQNPVRWRDPSGRFAGPLPPVPVPVLTQLYAAGVVGYTLGYNVIGPIVFAAEDAKLNAAARATAVPENQGRPAQDVVGSRAASLGRNIGSGLPVGKRPGTRSAIDFIIDGQVGVETRGALTDALREAGTGAGSVISPRGFSSPPKIVFTPRAR